MHSTSHGQTDVLHTMCRVSTKKRKIYFKIKSDSWISYYLIKKESNYVHPVESFEVNTQNSEIESLDDWRVFFDRNSLKKPGIPSDKQKFLYKMYYK